MFYDWLPGGWGGRNGRDGCNVTTACFGTGLMSQPVEGQERANPILTTIRVLRIRRARANGAAAPACARPPCWARPTAQ